MEILDDEGNLFGVVNLIDALAVLLVIIVVLGGSVFYLSGDEGESAVRYATVELGSLPEYVATSVSSGDVGTIKGSNQEFEVTDVYLTPSQEGYFVSVRAKLHGKSRTQQNGNRSVFMFGGDPLRNGDELSILTPEYSVSGVVRDVSLNGSEIPVVQRKVVMSIRGVDPAVARSISRGLTERVGGRTLARITNVSVRPSEVVVQSDEGRLHLRQHPITKDVRMGVEVVARRSRGSDWFHGKRLRVNSGLTLDLDKVTVNGRVIDVEP